MARNKLTGGWPLALVESYRSLVSLEGAPHGACPNGSRSFSCDAPRLLRGQLSRRDICILACSWMCSGSQEANKAISCRVAAQAPASIATRGVRGGRRELTKHVIPPLRVDVGRTEA